MRLFLLAALALASANAKDDKAFSLFSVVTFKNEDCTSNSATMMAGNRNGTCYTTTECSDKGGTSSGSCAMGFGTCCIFTKNKCAETIDQNTTYIQNEGFPTALTGTSLSDCSFTVKKCSDEICRIRLDFEQFTILGPIDTVEAENSICRDEFTITGLGTGNGVVPTLCGNNVGQHLYFEIGRGGSDTATLTFKFASTAGSRDFEVRVTQYACGSSSIPPEGCLQWHTGTEGRLMTFNFAGDTVHLQNQAYSICLRQEEGMCCVKYKPCTDTQSFSLFNDMAAAADTTAVHGSLCSKDYVILEESGGTCGTNNRLSRYCGGKFSGFNEAVLDSPVCDCTAPFVVGIHTNSANSGTAADDGDQADSADDAAQSRGICLEYSQVPCGQLN